MNFHLISFLLWEYTVTCTAVSALGPVVSSSFTGPGGVDLGQLQPLEQPDELGNFNYGAMVTRISGVHGDTYHCNASNNVSAVSDTFILSVASPPTNISAVFVSPTTIRVTWRPPSGGANVTGYVVHYNGSSGEERNVTLSPTALSYINNAIDCVGDVNITVVALSQHLSSQPQTITLHVPKVGFIQVRPVTATAVRVDWSPVGPGWEVTFILREQSYSVAKERVIYQNERVYRGNTSVTVEVNDVYPGYQHIFSVRHMVELVERGECEGETVTTSFEFDKTYFQIQFGPIQHCLTWEEERVMKTEAILHTHITHIIHERCPSCEDFSESFLRRGVFLCQDSPTMASYRSTIIGPGLPGSPISSTMVGIIQEWVSGSPSLAIDWLLVRVNGTCAAHIPSLAAPECPTTSSHLPSPALLGHISQVINACTVRQLGQQLCQV